MPTSEDNIVSDYKTKTIVGRKFLFGTSNHPKQFLLCFEFQLRRSSVKVTGVTRTLENSWKNQIKNTGLLLRQSLLINN